MAASNTARQGSSWALGFITTMALFLVMKVLVTGSEYEIEKAAADISIDFVRVDRDEDVNAKDRSPKRPAKQEPDEPPPPPKLDQVQRPNMDKASASADFGDLALGMNLNAPVDGDALAIVRVLPQYPNRALSRGIEGWVLLEFTINEVGLAMDPLVVDADPPNIFDRAAINAVRKWKYRPMMEGGRAVPRPGVRQLISFQIAK